jgi:hypothetical protein
LREVVVSLDHFGLLVIRAIIGDVMANTTDYVMRLKAATLPTL